MNSKKEMISATQVAAAAPATPMPALNIKIGSSTQLTIFERRDIFRGVITSIVPRNDANATVLKTNGYLIVIKMI